MAEGVQQGPVLVGTFFIAEIPPAYRGQVPVQVLQTRGYQGQRSLLDPAHPPLC